MGTRGIVAGTIGITVIAAAALRGVLRRFAVREHSMVPTIEDGDWLIARRRYGALRRGDIVVMTDPTGSGMQLVKRVIGLPGERVGVVSGRVTIDGALLADRWAHGSTGTDGEWDVPAEHVWVLGDNRGASASDGRILGPTALADVDWVVIARYWPTARARMF